MAEMEPDAYISYQNHNSGRNIIFSEGDYPFIVEQNGRFTHTKKGNDPMEEVRLKCFDENNRCKIVFARFVLDDKYEEKIAAFFASIGMIHDGERIRMKWDEIKGKEGYVHLKVDAFTDRKTGESRQDNSVSYFIVKDDVENNIRDRKSSSLFDEILF